MGLRHWSEFLYSLRDGLRQVRNRHRSSRACSGPEAEIAACTVPIFSTSKTWRQWHVRFPRAKAAVWQMTQAGVHRVPAWFRRLGLQN